LEDVKKLGFDYHEDYQNKVILNNNCVIFMLIHLLVLNLINHLKFYIFKCLDLFNLYMIEI